MRDTPPGDRPLVSVLMPTFNGERYIAAALASLQSQDHAELEILVIDDGSTDDTFDIVTQLAAGDRRIVPHRAQRRGIAASRNTGLAHARGTFITFLDHDDLCPPGKISRQVAHLTQQPGAVAVFGRTVIFSSAATAVATSHASCETPNLTMLLAAALFRRHTFACIGPLDTRFKLADDLDFILRLCEAGLDIAIETEVAVLHRRHPAQATADLAGARRETTLALAASLRRRRAAGERVPLRHPLLTKILP